MKEIKATIQPFMLDTVLAALPRIERLPGITLSEARAVSVQPGRYEHIVKVKLEIMVPETLVEAIVQTIERTAHTGNIRE